MKYFIIFLISFTSLFFYRYTYATEGNNMENVMSELNQLKNAFRRMEQDYKSKIVELERKVKYSQEVYVREQEQIQVQIQDQKYEERIMELEEKVSFSQEADRRDREEERRKPFYGTKGSLLNPDISVIADTFYHFSDQSKGVGEFTDNDLYFREVELSIQGYIYPGVKAEFYPVWEIEEGKVEIEEAFANFLTLPFNTSLIVGRQRVRFGEVNPIHQHSRDYVDVPLPVQNFLGAEGYIDEGFDLSMLVPWIKIPVTLGFGMFDGDKSLGEHGEEHEEEGEEGEKRSAIFESEPIEWRDHVFLAKINANIPFTRNFDASLGYHVMWDDNGGGPTAIHNGQISFRYRFPNSYRKLLWQNEIYVADIDDRDVKSKGFYSLLKYNLSRSLDAGVRYDWSELGHDDDIHQWAINPIMTWHMTESSYVRMQYRYGELEGFESVNEGLLQFVWGLGPHSHSLKN